MASKNRNLTTIVIKFPDHHSLITQLYSESDSFRSLCDDYLECQTVLDNIELSRTIMDPGYQQEYETLLGELEDELIHRIQSLNKNSI